MISPLEGSCCLSYKDTILKANHSNPVFHSISTQLLLILQRYYFESESQRYYSLPVISDRCCLSYKDTILKANHSNFALPFVLLTAVAYPTKILFWKRITARANHLSFFARLLLILQRYYFESESQPYWRSVDASIRCCLSYKDTILKANHSDTVSIYTPTSAVAYPTKILFWKRITALQGRTSAELKLLLILQRYYFESESQRGGK